MYKPGKGIDYCKAAEFKQWAEDRQYLQEEIRSQLPMQPMQNLAQVLTKSVRIACRPAQTSSAVHALQACTGISSIRRIVNHIEGDDRSMKTKESVERNACRCDYTFTKVAPQDKPL